MWRLSTRAFYSNFSQKLKKTKQKNEKKESFDRIN